MAKYRKIDPKIWNDEKFYTASLSCQHLFLFILTHPQMTPVGAMRTSPGGLEDELEWQSKGFPEAFPEAFQEGCDKGFWKYDRKAKFLWVPNFTKYNAPESPNVIKSWVGCWDDLPEGNTKNELFQSLKALLEGYGEGYQIAFREAFPKDYAESGAGAGAVINNISSARSFPDDWLAIGREANPKLSDEELSAAWVKFRNSRKCLGQPPMSQRFNWVGFCQNEFGVQARPQATPKENNAERQARLARELQASAG